MAAPMLPRYSTEASTTFLQLLQSKNYIGWYVFDFARDSSALWKAVATGLLWHCGLNYPEVGNFLNVSWRPKIKSIVEADQRYITQYGDKKYEEVSYWADIGAACMQIAIDFFIQNAKPDQAEAVRQGKCPSPSNVTAYTSLVSFLNICLCWYECKADGVVVTHCFQNKAKNEIALFINVAQEGDRLYFLWHQDFKCENVVLDFPYCMKVNLKGQPLIIGCELQLARPVGDPKDALIQQLLKVVETSAGLTLAVCQAIPPSASDQMKALQSAVNTLKALVASTKLPVDVMSPGLSQLLSLPISEQAASRPPHTITTCESYPEDPDFLEYHSHRFHRVCLSRHLQELRLTYPNIPMCPTCGEKLPDTVLDINAEVRRYYEDNRKAATTHFTTDYPVQRNFAHLTLPAQNSTVQCAMCQNVYDRKYFMWHGCIVCMMCSLRTYSERKACGMCGGAFREDEVTALTNFYYQTYGGNR